MAIERSGATPHLRSTVLRLTLPFTSLMPVYAQDLLHSTATTLRLLDGAIGSGAFGACHQLLCAGLYGHGAAGQPMGRASQRLGVQNAVLGQGIAALLLGGLHRRELRTQPQATSALQANFTQGLQLLS